MQATQSVGISMIFWFVGALTAMAGAVLYIEFGLALPRHLIDGKMEAVVRNGGDLNYVRFRYQPLRLFLMPHRLATCSNDRSFSSFASTD